MKAIYAVVGMLISEMYMSTGLAAAYGPPPLEAVAAVEVIVDQAISPDGQLLAYTYTDLAQAVHTRIVRVGANKVIELGSEDESTWAPVWSPDGRHLAFYMSRAGITSVALWDRKSEGLRRFASVKPAPRAQVGVSWAADGSGFTLLLEPIEATEETSKESETGVSAKARNADGAVVVFTSDVGGEQSYPSDLKESSSQLISTADHRCDEDSPLRRCDLAFVDVDSEAIQRVVEGKSVSWYALSPDGHQLAYAVHNGWAPTMQQPMHDLFVADLESGQLQQLAEDAYIHNGETVGWSPDGQRIALLTHKPGESPVLTAIRVANGQATSIADGNIRGFNSGLDEIEPVLLWGADGEDIYTLHVEDGSLWRMDVTSGLVSSVRVFRGRRIVGVAEPTGPARGDGTIIVATETQDKARGGIHRVDPKMHKAWTLVERPWNVYPRMSVTATGTISFIASDQRNPPRVWFLDGRSPRLIPAAAAHNELDRYSLGSARVVGSRTEGGEITVGTLLLPPSYKQGQRLPLVVWVYGGDRGSEYVNHFGLAPGNAPVFNLQVLATRGYAVLFPDAPLSVGEPMKELQAAVMNATDAVIEQGYADPDRIAVMGQSYGSYCAMSLIARTTRFKAAILTGTMSPDLLRMYLHMEPDGTSPEGYFEHGQGRMGGTPWQYPDRYIDESPIYRFDRIETAVLIAKGNLDGPLGFSDSAFVALRRLGKKVEYRIYRDEGHVISRKVNVVDFWQRRLEFLAENLKLSTNASGVVSAGE